MPGASGVLARDPAEPVPRSGRWGDLRIRVLSAVVLVPLALACVWIGGLAFRGLIAAAAVGLAVEWMGLRRAVGGRASFSPPGRGSQRGAGGGSVLITPAGFLYIAAAVTSLLWLRADPLVGRANVLVLLVMVWSSDVGAYLVGRAVGGPRLAPRISPGKTVSGAVGGLMAAVVVGTGAALALSQTPHLLRAGVLAACLGVVSQAGDLFESWVKRQFGVKDSGTLIPGHGGLFDRLDALLAAAPAAALLALWVGRGVAWWE